MIIISWDNDRNMWRLWYKSTLTGYAIIRHVSTEVLEQDIDNGVINDNNARITRMGV